MTETFAAVAETAALRETAHAAGQLLAQQLPTVARLTPVVVEPSGEPPVDDWLAGHAVVGTFVGAASYRVAIAVRPELLPTAGDGDSVAVDYVRTALSDAMSCFGAGVLAGLRVDDARALFADEDAAVVRLDDSDSVAGAFAVLQTSRPNRGGDVLERLGRISGVEMDLTVQIGRTRLAVRDVLGLEAGSIVELDRSAGAPADILLNGRLIAHGEVVVVDQDYAVRITSIVDASNQAQ
ncbi:MAG TPA: flagellar motor switch protein FliN [Gryllotalpicola sp.]